MDDRPRPSVQAGRDAFLRREAADIATRLAKFVDHADDLGRGIAPADHRLLQQTYAALRRMAGDPI